MSLHTVVDDAATRWGVWINHLDIERVDAPGGLDITALLEMLASLRVAGIRTSEEFEAKRGQVLSRLTTGARDTGRLEFRPARVRPQAARQKAASALLDVDRHLSHRLASIEQERDTGRAGDTADLGRGIELLGGIAHSSGHPKS